MVPTRFGLLLYPGFEVLDVFGPLEALNVISRPDFNDLYPPGYVKGITLSIIAEDTVVTPATACNEPGSSISEKFTAQYNFSNAPALDVLIIPGGMGSQRVTWELIQWVKKVLPSLQYLITVCTGAHIAAKAGALDGLRATSNKMAWV
jgi:putative intracellular protease/amidase